MQIQMLRERGRVLLKKESPTPPYQNADIGLRGGFSPEPKEHAHYGNRGSLRMIFCLLVLVIHVFLLSVHINRSPGNDNEGDSIRSASVTQHNRSAPDSQYHRYNSISNNNTSTSISPLQLSILKSTCASRKTKKDWKILCKNNIVESVVQLLEGGDEVNVIQIGAHVGFEPNDPLAKGLSGLLDKIVNVTQNNELRKHFHWTFVEPSPPNFKRLQINMLKYSHICDMNSINTAVVSDLADKKSDGDMIFYSIRDTIDPETGFDTHSNKTLPSWVTQIPSFSRETVMKAEHRRPFNLLGLDMEEYIIETNVSTKSYTDLMNQVLVHTTGDGTKEPPLLVLVDTEGYDCDIVEGISPNSPFLPKYLIFEHRHCMSEGARKHLTNMGYNLHWLFENALAIQNSANTTEFGTTHGNLDLLAADVKL